jgi:hypothetical protein
MPAGTELIRETAIQVRDVLGEADDARIQLAKMVGKALSPAPFLVCWHISIRTRPCVCLAGEASV